MNLLWFPITLLCAFSLATSDVLTKRAIAAYGNVYLIAWLRMLLMLPGLTVLLLLAPRPAIGPEFLPSIMLSIPLEIMAIILYFNALKLSPLGLTIPFLALTPLFLLVIPSLLLGERVTAQAGCGVVLIAAGSYALNLHSSRDGLLAPFRAIISEPGARCMIGVALLYSITSVLVKKAISSSSPYFFAGIYPILMFCCLTPLALWKGRNDLKLLFRGGLVKAVLFPAAFSLVETVSGIIALGMTNVAYMISVKRLSLLGGVLYGYFLFGEEHLRERLVGAVLMVAGVALIVTGGK